MMVVQLRRVLTLLRERAKDEFKRLYREKTGNEKESNKLFDKKANFYYNVNQESGTNSTDNEVNLQEQEGKLV